MPLDTALPVLARVVRDGVVESVHRGALVLADTSGILTAAGDPALPTYVRSAAKPFQALATLTLLDGAGVALDGPGLAIACASHTGTADHQVEAAHLLARAGLDESALRCPPALPSDLATLLDQRTPTSLAHNCSGKHAAYLLAQTVVGGDPADYLALRSGLQRLVREALAAATGDRPEGPGVDGCGAPAWVLPLRALAVGFARLAAGALGLGRVRDAMRAQPELVGGEGCDDTAVMRADARVVAKRGAEAVLAAGLVLDGQPLGMAVKIADGAHRAAGPVVADALAAAGVHVPAAVRSPPVLGGGAPHGAIEVDPVVASLLAKVYGLSNRG
jgi:L-asparaginase II